MATDFITYLVEASICQGICYLFYWLFLRKETSFRFNRLYILVVLVLSVVVPLLEIPVDKPVVFFPQQTSPVSRVAMLPASEPAPSDNLPVEPAANIPLAQLLVYGYIAVCLLLSMRLLYQVGYLWLLWLTGKRQIYKQYKVICTDGKLLTSSFFGWLFWDTTQVLQPEEKTLILQHESAHIAGRHSWDILFLQLLRIGFWFNPVLYLFEKSLQEVHEYLADAAVVTPRNAYTSTHLLVEQSFIGQHISLLHSFHGSLIHKRIAMIQAYQQQKSLAFWKTALSISLAAGILYVQACKPKEVMEPAGMAKLDPDNTYWLSAHGTVVSSNRFAEGEYLYGHYPKPDVDEYAYPIGGFNPFRTYIQNTLQEPYKIKPAGMRKKVFVQFTVDKEGYIRNARVAPGMGLGPGYDEEAIKVIANGPRWVPAKKDGKPVEASMMEAVIFGQNEGFSRFAGADYPMVCGYKSTGGPAPVGEPEQVAEKFTTTYPEEARQQWIEGTVVVGFTVQTDGKATGFEVLQAIHPALDTEALRAAQAANVSWKPAIKNGKARASNIIVSFGFYLAD